MAAGTQMTTREGAPQEAAEPSPSWSTRLLSNKAMWSALGAVGLILLTAFVTPLGQKTWDLVFRPDPAASAGATSQSTAVAGPPPAATASTDPTPIAALRSVSDYCKSGWVVPASPAELEPRGDTLWNDWAAAVKGVKADLDLLELTVQGPTDAQVIITGIRAKVLSREPAAEGTHVRVGCGGEAEYRHVDIDLDKEVPVVSPAEGGAGKPLRTPYEVSSQDAEIFAINAHTSQYDVEWVLEVDWASMGRTGTLTVPEQDGPLHITGSLNTAATCTWGETGNVLIATLSKGCDI